MFLLPIHNQRSLRSIGTNDGLETLWFHMSLSILGQAHPISPKGQEQRWGLITIHVSSPWPYYLAHRMSLKTHSVKETVMEIIQRLVFPPRVGTRSHAVHAGRTSRRDALPAGVPSIVLQRRRECSAGRTPTRGAPRGCTGGGSRKEGPTDGDQQEPRAEQFPELLRKEEVGSLSQEGG